MLVGGLLGEMGTINEVVGFVIGMIGWLYVVYLIFGGALKLAVRVVIRLLSQHSIL